MNAKIDKFVNCKFGIAMDKYCNSVWYIITIGAICVLCHSLNIPVTGAAFMTILVVIPLIFCKNSFTLVPFALMCSFVLSEETNPPSDYYTPWKLVLLCVLLAVALAALLFNLIFYGKWRLLFRRTYLTVSLCIVVAFLITAGWFSPFFRLSGFGTGIAIAATMFAPYSMIVNCGEYEGKKTVKYFTWTLIVAAAAIVLCMLKHFAVNDFDFSNAKNILKLGFVGPNTGAALITLSIPMTFYLIYEYKHGYLFFLLVAFELGAIFLSQSRASLVIALPGTLIVAIALCFKKKSGRLGYYITFGIFVLAFIVIAIVFRHKITELFKALFVDGFTGNGRTMLWKLGFEHWLDNPIFGSGFWILRIINPVQFWYYSFHCTPLTYLYCGGLVAFVAYVYHRYKTVRLVFSAKLTPERVFIALTVLAMLCNAMIDIAMTSPAYIIYYSIMLAIIECDVNKIKSERKLLSPDNTITESVK